MRKRMLLTSVAAAALLMPSGALAASQQRGDSADAERSNAKAQDAARDAALRADARRARAARRAAAKGGDGQHGPGTGHLPGSQRNVKLIGRLDLTDREDEFADVAGDPRPGFAYLSARGATAETCPTGGGIHVADIRNASKPKRAAFIRSPANAFPGEGVHAIRLRTRSFNGVVLGVNHELCNDAPEGATAGLALYDVTKPTRPTPLSVGFGDTTQFDEPGVLAEYHSIFLWQQGDRAFAMGTDNDEFEDVDIFEITDPRNPVLISETDALAFENFTQEVFPLGDIAFLHDMQVKYVNGRWTGLLSYWDAGYVLLDLTDPANPQLIENTEWSSPDPEFPQWEVPEGNAHQAWFSEDNRYFIGTDEDFAPYRLDEFSIRTGPNAGQFEGSQVSGGASPAALEDQVLNGPTVYGGYACPGSAPVPQRSAFDLQLEAGEEAILVVQRGPSGDPSAPEGACFPGEKAAEAAAAGWDAVLIVNRHRGDPAADSAFCGSGGYPAGLEFVTVCTTHEALHRLFGTEPNFELPVPTGDAPPIGTVGDDIEATVAFDGWGYIHLYDARTLEEIDTYAIPEAKDEAFAQGFGDLSVHEVQFQRGERRRIAWLSWYSGGVRVVRYGRDGLQEVGHYIHEDGNDFWGIDFGRDRAGRTYALASDRDDGLWIFAYTR